jgi:NCS2 family nucleobase:cation symporter-2
MQDTMVYKVNDMPPPAPLLVLSLQHMLFMFAASAFPAMLVREIGGDLEMAASLVSLTMIMSGIGSIMQASHIKYIGSGYLCPNVCGPSYLTASLHAAWIGGIPLMRGMVLFSGLIEMGLAPMVKKLKFMFPPIIVGLVVAMVGVSVVSIATGNFFGVAFAGDSIRWEDLLIGFTTLMIMVGTNIWGKGWVRMYCLLIGTGIGWVLALLLTPETLSDLALVGSKPLLAFPSMPFAIWHITFDPALVLPFIIISICATLKSFGNLLAAQQISEPELTEPNLRPISYGLMADGLITSLSGLVGALAVDTSSSNVGLAAATRACSRWICIAAGVLFMIMAFMPKIGAAIATIPKPVLGASLIFAGSFMICTGLREMMKENFDTRAIFTVGISIIIGLSTGFMPELYARFPEFMQSFFSDPLATTTILSVVLYQIFYFDLLYLKKKTGTP